MSRGEDWSEERIESAGESELGSPEDASVIRHEEELRVGAIPVEAGAVRVRKFVETEQVEDVVPRATEYADVERAAPLEQDSGEIETLPDGSISVPVYEEQLVVQKRMVVRERIIVRKRTVSEERRVQAELQKERVEVEADPGVELQGEGEGV